MICNARLSWETARSKNHNNKKVEPALRIFGQRLLSGFRDELWKNNGHLLELINDCIIKPLFATNSYDRNTI